MYDDDVTSETGLFILKIVLLSRQILIFLNSLCSIICYSLYHINAVNDHKISIKST